jgi:hypothetical protein
VRKKKKIIVVTSAGLGNRMRVLSSCIQTAIKDDRTLWIVWPKNSTLGCDITDIFESIGINYYVPQKWIHYMIAQIYRHGAIRRFYKIYKLISRIFFDSSIFDADIEYNNQLESNINDKTILVATCFAFGSKHDYKLFNFTDYLKKKAEKEFQKINGPYIGIHIRRTDHVDIIQQSPLEKYMDQIDKSLLDHPTQKFFLATDDETVKNYLTHKYKRLIYTFNHTIGRIDIQGIYGAVIELLLLSKSTKLICSALSSYSDTAILIGDIKEVINV